MLWQHAPVLEQPAAREWHTFLKNALLQRIPAEKMAKLFDEGAKKTHGAPSELPKVLMTFRASGRMADDPLLFGYMRVALQQGHVRTDAMLLALLECSQFAKGGGFVSNEASESGFPTCEERTFNVLTQVQMKNDAARSLVEYHGLAFALARWMNTISEHEMSRRLDQGAMYSLDAFAFGMYEALAVLVLAVVGSPNFRKVGEQGWWKTRRPMVVNEMENFDTQVLQSMQSQWCGRLQAMTSLPPFLETDKDGRPIFADAYVLRSINDLPIVNSRAGLYIWLNACLCSRPFTDDMAILTYLQARYNGGNQTMVEDLLIASFDVLTNVLLRSESTQSVKVISSFICNKLPLLLNSSLMSTAGSIEASCQMAFMSISMDALPPFSPGATQMQDKLRRTRLEFLKACVLHHHIAESAISGIVQEPPNPLPKFTRYTKDALVSQCSNNVGRLEPLIEELDKTVGNAGAIAGCIIELINNLCNNRDTMALKNVCNMLVKKFSTVDIVMQYAQPPNLLLPLCNQLNDWTHDQDQSEFTPAYEEFSSVLLFTIAVMHRYDLNRTDVGLPPGENFVSRLLQDISVSKLSNELTSDQDMQLGKWVEGLYATDELGETSGISDEVMRPCPPQAFYLLVPTLFDQSVLACKSGALSTKTFKGGLELLVEPFLLPSLIGGLSWLIKHSWEDHGDAEILLQIFDKLLNPSSSSPETKAMHVLVLEIVARPLYNSLRNLQHKRPNMKELGSLMETLQPLANQLRTTESSGAEMEEWSSTPNGGMTQCLRNVIRDQVAWASTVEANVVPRYTHKLYAAICEIKGVDAVLEALTLELEAQTQADQWALALDVCTAIVSAPLASLHAPTDMLGTPMSQAPNPMLSVRDLLQLRTRNVQQLLQMRTGQATSLVQLARRVEAQLAVTQVPQINIDVPMQGQSTDQVMAALGLADDAPPTSGPNTSMDGFGSTAGADLLQNTSLDQAINLDNATDQNMPDLSGNDGGMATDPGANLLNGLNLDISAMPQGGQNTAGTNMSLNGADGQQNQEEDIFAGLDMDLGNDFDF